MKFFLENLNWIGPCVVSLIAARIAWKNHSLAKVSLVVSKNQEKMQHNTFCFQILDRRLGVYTEMRNILEAGSSGAEITGKQEQDFRKKTEEVGLLFDTEIVAVREKICFKLPTYRDRWKKENQPQEYYSTLADHSQMTIESLEKWFKEKHDALPGLFEKYISFSKFVIKK